MIAQSVTHTPGGLEGLIDRLGNLDLTDAMRKAQKIIEEGHVKGVLQGIQGNGAAMPPTRYRNSVVIAKPKGIKGLFRVASGSGGTAAINNNLTTEQYRKLTGPPLAPRGRYSRVISNFVARYGFTGTEWFVEAMIGDVISRKGVPFLLYHFGGEGRLPRRDLRGIRPADREKLDKMVRDEILKLVR